MIRADNSCFEALQRESEKSAKKESGIILEV
jgi:hypothetical protein